MEMKSPPACFTLLLTSSLPFTFYWIPKCEEQWFSCPHSGEPRGPCALGMWLPKNVKGTRFMTTVLSSTEVTNVGRAGPASWQKRTSHLSPQTLHLFLPEQQPLTLLPETCPLPRRLGTNVRYWKKRSPLRRPASLGRHPAAFQSVSGSRILRYHSLLPFILRLFNCYKV